MPARSALVAGVAAASLIVAAGCSRSGSEPAASSAPAPAAAPKPRAAAEAPSGVAPALQQSVDTINKALYAADAMTPPPAPAAAPEAAAPSGNVTGPAHLPAAAPAGNVTGPAANTGGNVTAATAAPALAYKPVLIKAEVLLARAGFSPGVIDGQPGTNVRHAIAEFADSRGLKSDGDLTPAVWAALNAPGAQPVASTYTVTPQDAAGPYYPAVGEDMWKAHKLDHVGYVTPLEMLAERFHMDQALLQALNPGADFGKAGTTLVVAQTGPITLPKIDHIQVDKANAAVRAYDADDKLIAFAPATVGSTDRPSPSGVHKVKGVAHDPTYTYDPKKLTWGPRKRGKFVVPSGPNNPVGAVWIDLDAPSYGLHGTPDPKEIGKTASHGCVRMTNWDALQIAASVKPGVVVTFENSRGG